MKAKAKQPFVPLELTLIFETLEELQAFEMIFYAEGIVSAEFIKKHLNTDVLPPEAYTENSL